jgi:hypothetical protein
MNGDRPDQGCADQLQHGDQAGRQQQGAHMGAVAELQYGRDQVDQDDAEQLPDVMMLRVVDLADEEAEVQGQGQDDEEAEDDLLGIHVADLLAR